jgi:3-isopropylmalate/(R)-2-methylmalate dehydratase large subunit
MITPATANSTNRGPRTLFEKLWESHLVAQEPDAPALLYIDLHLVHEVTSPQAFSSLRRRGMPVRRPDKTVATVDHSLPTSAAGLRDADPAAAEQIRTLENNAREFGIRLFGVDHPERGIVHVIGPELGLTHPGMIVVCGDSHTSTHGAFGALAFGIGTTEVEHVLASQCLLQRKPKPFQVRVEGKLQPGVTAKDIILALLARIGVSGGTGHVFEYMGTAIESLSMEERMTVCNMSIEGGAKAGLIAPDDVTFEYLAGRQFAPRGLAFDRAVARWRQLRTDDGAEFVHSVTLDARQLQPMITYGTNPGMGLPVTGSIPDPDATADSTQKQSLAKALAYMGLRPGQPLIGQPINVVFVGSCTNGRLSDLRLAASVMEGRKVAPGVRMLVVPGSREVKRKAEQEGLHQVFLDAGAEWREAGCSMCIAMNPDRLEPGQYSVSTSNRNFEGRQGMGSRTFLASPLSAAAAAVTGRITDVRTLMDRRQTP